MIYIETTEKCPVSLEIPLASFQKIMGYTRAVNDTEINGFIEAELVGNTVKVGEVYLLPQEVTATTAEMTEEGVSEFLLKQIQAGKTQLPRGQWHSHVNFSTFCSGTDKETYKKTMNGGTWSISIVVNKNADVYAVFSIYQPIAYEWEDIPVSIIYDSLETSPEIKKEVAEKVKTKVYTVPKKIIVPKPGKTMRLYGAGASYNPATGGSSSGSHLEEQGGVYYHSRSLPKDPKTAQLRIARLGLIREWDDARQQYVFVDIVKGDKWIDEWNVVQNFSVYDDDDDIENLIGKRQEGELPFADC